MTYLRNTWYLAAWDRELPPRELLARTLLDERVVLFRDASGTARALQDRCPHRFAPLSRGRVCDGQIECGYHGLRFGGAATTPTATAACPGLRWCAPTRWSSVGRDSGSGWATRHVPTTR